VASSTPAELARLNYDARSILTTWGDRHASETGLHDYGNRDWAGLTIDYYLPRWRLFFDSVSTDLKTGEAAKKIDWYALGDTWNRSRTRYSEMPRGSAYAAALAIAEDLAITPRSLSADEPALRGR
jgi:alpha-N-acetylglucosaminidase